MHANGISTYDSTSIDCAVMSSPSSDARKTAKAATFSGVVIARVGSFSPSFPVP